MDVLGVIIRCMQDF